MVVVVVVVVSCLVPEFGEPIELYSYLITPLLGRWGGPVLRVIAAVCRAAATRKNYRVRLIVYTRRSRARARTMEGSYHIIPCHVIILPLQ